jgi:hypothetical protein
MIWVVLFTCTVGIALAYLTVRRRRKASAGSMRH